MAFAIFWLSICWVLLHPTVKLTAGKLIETQLKNDLAKPPESGIYSSENEIR